MTFDPSKRLWTKLGNAENPEIRKAVEQCLFGALSVLYRRGIKVILESDKCRSVTFDGCKLM